MTKQELVELIDKYVPDGEEIAFGGFWFRADAEAFLQVKLSDEQWEKIVSWFANMETGYDLNDAYHYAKETD